MTVPNESSLPELNEMLWRGDTVSAGAAAERLFNMERSSVTGGTVPDWLVTVYDKFWQPAATVGDFIECTGMDPRNGLASSTLKIKGDDPVVPIFQLCEQTMVGVTIETEGLRFAFYVDTFDLVFDRGEWTGTANLVGIWDILNYIQVWPDWWMPIQAQVPFSHAILLGPIVSSIEIMIMENALRLQTGLWELINNAASFNPDVLAWFGALIEYGGNLTEMLQCPIVVAFTDPFTDTSVLTCRTIRMETCASVIKDITRSTGVDVRVDLWFPGDPQPPDVYVTLQQPTYVVRVTDRSQITGPTHTILDSVLKTVVDLIGSVFGDMLSPFIQGYQSVPGLPQGFFISPMLGINWVPPWVLLIAPDSGQPGSIETCKITSHTPKGWQHIIGGRCVSGDTLVHTANGLVEAKTLDNQVVMILSENGDYRAARWRSYGEQQLFRVTFANGDEILATEQHEWIVTDCSKRIITCNLIGKRVPLVADAQHYGRSGYLLSGDAVEVIRVEATNRFEVVYCCEEPITNTWVAGRGYLTSNSPQWLNDLINIFFQWIIDAISILLGFTGIPNDMLAGFLNNSFLAFQLWESFSRRNAVGPYHPAIEVFHATSSAPYNLESVFDFVNAFWDARGWTCIQATCRDGQNYKLGKDIFRGQLVSVAFMNRTRLYTDFLEQVAWRIDRNTRDLMLQIGDGKAIESPLTKHQRNISGLLEALNVLTLAPQSG